MPSFSTKSIQNHSSIQKITKERIFQEDEQANFIANDTTSVLDNITEKKCPVDNNIIRYMCRQITDKLHIPEVGASDMIMNCM